MNPSTNMSGEAAAPSEDDQLVATLTHCARHIPPNTLYDYDLASVLSQAAERIAKFVAAAPSKAEAALPDAQPVSETVQMLRDALEMFVGSNPVHSLCQHEGRDAFGRVKGTWSEAAEVNARATLRSLDAHPAAAQRVSDNGAVAARPWKDAQEVYDRMTVLNPRWNAYGTSREGAVATALAVVTGMLDDASQAHGKSEASMPEPDGPIVDVFTADRARGKSEAVGWQWVPTKPTMGMLIAGNHGQPGEFSAPKVWQDMLAAAARSQALSYLRPHADRAQRPAAPADGAALAGTLRKRLIDLLTATLDSPGDGLSDRAEARSLVDELRALASTQGDAAQQPEGAPPVTAQQMRDLQRFQETAEDDNSYDVPKGRMRSLADLGAIRHLAGGRYTTTTFGDWLLDRAAPAQQPEGLREIDIEKLRQARRLVVAHAFDMSDSHMAKKTWQRTADDLTEVLDAALAATPVRKAEPVPFDDSLNELGWKMNDWLLSQGVQFDGRVFNHMKEFLRECIQQWLQDHHPAPAPKASEQPAPAPVVSEAVSKAQEVTLSASAAPRHTVTLLYGSHDEANDASDTLTHLMRERYQRAQQAAPVVSEGEKVAAEPTDAEIAECVRSAKVKCVHPDAATTIDIARAVLARWGAQPSAPVELQHMAVAEDGVLRWLSGRRIANCELYAVPGWGLAPPLFTAPPHQAPAQPSPPAGGESLDAKRNHADAIAYMALCEAAGYDAGPSGLDWSPEEWMQQLARDAARWRWLRDNGHADWEPGGERTAVWELHFNAPETDVNNLESAVDARMAAIAHQAPKAEKGGA